MKEVRLLGMKTESIEVRVPLYSAYEEVRDQFYQNVGLSKDSYLENNKIYRNVDFSSSHNCSEKTYVKEKPTQKELDILEAFRLLNKYIGEVAK